MSDKETGSKRKGRPAGKGSRSNSRQNSLTRDDEPWKCELCKQNFTDPNAKMLECQRCKGHYCIKCLKKPDAEYSLLASSDLMWFCAQCREKVQKNIAVDVEIEKRCAEIMESYEARISTLENEIKGKCGEDRVREIVKEEVRDKGVSDPDHKEEGDGTSQNKKEGVISSVFSEINERKQRENNIVIHGIEEAVSENASERVKHDKERIMEILNTCIGKTDDKQVVKVKRLGKYKPENPKRPLLATLPDTDTKKMLFQNIRKLATEGEKYKDVRISNDFTQAERDQERKLVSEMKELQKNSGEFLYRIRGPPWARRIVKLRK
ncbi:hypothetical protein FSP39_006297 [Pinctada imbricata]|uniref:Uncharacterized protein n=1 Tax=Pinctada imbricata TaxID=66713 RepID=A0AA89C3N8_PINIB|nr:hypothetical protein FSP39_006297 [Pinctada imbricata]